jgi:hypothetical protein
LHIANRNSSGTIASHKKISEQPFNIYPGDYVVLTEDVASLNTLYLVKNAGAVLSMSSLPSYPDDKGTVVLLNLQGEVVDEVTYNENWHFALVANNEGVALERVDPNTASNQKTNWHSAATTAGYGTPTYQNSQYKNMNASHAKIEVSPKTFSPDMDGYDDLLTILYNMKEPGYVATVIIFDGSGRPVRYLVKNELLGEKGKWIWDGLDDKKQKLPIGTYIIFTEVFNLQGKKEIIKNTAALARRLN